MTATDRLAAVVTPARTLTVADLERDVFGLRSQVERGEIAALHTDDAVVVAAAIRALEGWANEVHLLPPALDIDVLPEGTTVLSAAGELDAQLRTPEGDDVGVPTSWMVYTSGTTGAPKAIGHTAATLARTVVRSDRSRSFVWGLLYDPNRMAGLQVLMQALETGVKVVAPPLDASLAERISVLVENGVTAMSATPTLWRQMLQTVNSRELDLEQITLGGEIADQRVLDALAARFPFARIVHVFASTETGAAFSVTDGRAGFPLSYLQSAPRSVELDIREDILYVHCPGVSAAGSDGFAATGDIVEVVGDRVFFKGRASGVVNVGGANVWPEEVEDVLRRHHGVIEAVVTAKPNPMSGNVLVAQVVARPEVDAKALRKELRSWARSQVPSTHVPAMIQVVDAVKTSTTGKVKR